MRLSGCHFCVCLPTYVVVVVVPYSGTVVLALVLPRPDSHVSDMSTF